MKTHRDLDAWNKAMNLVKAIYQLTGQFPKHEQFGLAAQMRRAAVSIPSNIAEGAARNSKKEFAHYLYISRGSLSELQTQIQIAEQLELCATQVQLHEAVDDLFYMIQGLLRKLA